MEYHIKTLNSLLALTAILSLLLIASTPCEAQLSTAYYRRSCPNAPNLVRTAIRRAIAAERRMAASLIRLHFHDCFVQGCDGSVLLDQTPTIQSEKTAIPNNNSIRGFEVIEAAKAAVERACPRVVSCADVLALAALYSSEYVGGPLWPLRLGRRDSTTANRARANSDLPPPFATLSQLITFFANKNLNTRDMVALSGSHTLGQAQCFTFRTRIYNGTTINPSFAGMRQNRCPQTAGNGDSNLAPLDLVTPNSFDNNYFRNLISQRGLLDSDQILLSGVTESIVRQYVSNRNLFEADFASAMLKMSEIELLTGQSGIIRRVCNAIN